MATGVDLDDTTNCPLADVCQACGAASPDRRVWTVDTPMGVACLTLCRHCPTSGPAGMGLVEAVEAVLAHCHHLGIDADEMAAVRAAEQDRDMDNGRGQEAGR